MIFCDTSAIAKLYVLEHGSPAMRRAVEAQGRAFASELARVELMSVLHRRFREKDWSRDDFDTAMRQFANDDTCGIWNWLPIEPSILTRAADVFRSLPQTVYLRGADCVHLVTAATHNFGEIYTYDRRQTAAALTLGLRPITA